MENRQHFIDWIRVLAFMLLILFHCCMPFVRFNWEIKDQEHSLFLDRLIVWLHQWRLPLLFFISGVGVRFALQKRSTLAFFGERVTRLFIPLLFAMFFTIPSQVYFEWMQKGKIDMSYLEFYPSVWDLVPYPDGTLTWSHMWFVVYLFTFTLLLLPVFALSKINTLRSWKQKLNPLFQNPITLLLPILPLAWYYFTLYLRWPEQGSLLDDWFVFTFSITLYFLGFFLSDLSAFWASCERYRKPALFLMLVCLTILYVQFWWEVQWPKLRDPDDIYVYGALNATLIWTTIVSIIGFGKKHLNFSNRFLRYASPAVYPYYILHQTVIVGAGYFITQLEIPLALKLMALIMICIVTIALIYHVLIRPFVVTRILFGLKPKNNERLRNLDTREHVEVAGRS